MKIKKILLSLIALNAVTAPALAKTSKYDKLYNKIEKNLNTGKFNLENYKLIERALNERNKELKDLYLESEYIVKPEYLEWQIFFSSFYNNSHKGKESRKIFSKEDREGSKYVDLGVVNIPTKQIKKTPLKLNVSDTFRNQVSEALSE